MSYGRAYTQGDFVKVDQGVWTKNPTLGPCTVDAEVLADSKEAEVVVYLTPTDPEDGGPVYAQKDRVSP